MSGNSWNIREFFNRLPDTQDAVDRVREEVSDLLDTWGLDPAYVGAGPGDLDDSQGAYRFQYMSEYIFSRGRGGRGFASRDSGFPVQFKTILYTTNPITDEMERYLREVHNARLKTLFDTNEYEGYMTGFGFWEKQASTERDTVVPASDVPETGIGIPRWECEVYFDSLAGAAHGYSLDFEVEESVDDQPDAPQEEVWKIRSFNNARNDYEVSPPPRSNARERAKAAKGKTAYLTGKPIGSITSRGTIWWSKSHKSPAAATYKSREQVLADPDTAIPYQRLSVGARLWKVAEDNDSVYFVADKPVRFDPADPDAVDVGATGTRSVSQHLRDPSETATTFVVQQDEEIRGALGRFPVPTERRISEGTEFL